MIYDTLPMRTRLDPVDPEKWDFSALPCLVSLCPPLSKPQVVRWLPKPETLYVWTSAAALHMCHPSVRNRNRAFLTPFRQPSKKLTAFPRAGRHQTPVSVGRCPKASFHNRAIGVSRHGARFDSQVDQGQVEFLGTTS